MGKVELPYVNIYRSGGKALSYYRRDGLRKRIPGEPGSPEFLAAYQRIHAEHEAAGRNAKQGAAPGTLAALIERYKQSPDWRSLKPSSKADYEKALTPLHVAYGHCPVAGIQRHHVRAIMEKYATKPVPGKAEPALTPRRANKIVTVLSILMSYAIGIGWLTGENPAFRPKKLKVGKYLAWSDEQVETFLERAPSHMRRACLLAVCTGQRGIDLAGMTWRVYDGAAIEVIAEKTDTGDGVPLWIPVHPALKAELDASPKTALTILTRADGSRWGSVLEFQKAVSDAIRAAGLPKGVVWHGLRKTASRWLAEAGCADREIMAITGHKTVSMVSRYTEQADQKRRATAAITKLSARWKGGQ